MVENPGSYNETAAQHPEMSDQEVLSFWEGALLRYQAWVKSQKPAEKPPRESPWAGMPTRHEREQNR